MHTIGGRVVGYFRVGLWSNSLDFWFNLVGEVEKRAVIGAVYNILALQEVTEESYLEVAALKTASTFMASTEAGAMLGCGSEAEIENLCN